VFLYEGSENLKVLKVQKVMEKDHAPSPIQYAKKNMHTQVDDFLTKDALPGHQMHFSV